jgi:hypothetical protein
MASLVGGYVFFLVTVTLVHLFILINWASIDVSKTLFMESVM